jgi:hypothetical protein
MIMRLEHQDPDRCCPTKQMGLADLGFVAINGALAGLARNWLKSFLHPNG